ncbi:hemerythrin domain-containing protein [Haliea sp. E1-2-M8]|uniref:hemerythrin domain-containing protein n=1 Tax=Haliea sp. E1-2-M8 TaxID=3064706 RepID=UPI002720A49B|nr:hemerythrin domain-containing protein [Haliea sp. E1-2-M8]MDO8863630.1 hemerythrin domain-containing protein [Haliea sp. E1-2-M8]
MKRLRRDHRNLNRLFDMLEEQVARYDRDSTFEPDLLLILDIVAYLNDYPRIYHHPLEEEAVALMVERNLGDNSVNEFIHDQHQNLEQATERLSSLFNMIVNDHPVPIEQTREALDSYLEMSRKHLQSEEDRLFPVMEKVLGNDEWEVVASRLPERLDPLFAENPDDAFVELRRRM